jgi:hypothetical protein
LGHHAHTRTNLQYGQLRTGIYGVGNPTGNTQVGQEVLTQILFWSNLFHDCKNTKLRSHNKKKNNISLFSLVFSSLGLPLSQLAKKELWLRRTYNASGNKKKSALSFCISLVFT